MSNVHQLFEVLLNGFKNNRIPSDPMNYDYEEHEASWELAGPMDNTWEVESEEEHEDYQ